jgi:hypothetical protein
LVPFVGCTILSIIFAIKQPKEYPDPSYPYQTEGPLAFLSTGWFFIGLVISAVFLGILFMNDAFNLVEKVLKKRRMKKW